MSAGSDEPIDHHLIQFPKNRWKSEHRKCELSAVSASLLEFISFFLQKKEREGERQVHRGEIAKLFYWRTLHRQNVCGKFIKKNPGILAHFKSAHLQLYTLYTVRHIMAV